MTRLPLQHSLTAAGVVAAAAVVAAGSLLAPPGGLAHGVRLDAVLLGLAVLAAFAVAGALAGARSRAEQDRRVAELELELRRRAEDLERLAERDALTAAYTRRHFFERLGVEVRRARRYGRAVSCILLDVDRFAAVNREQGQQFGDFVLAELALLLTGDLRESDLVARFEGDEFAVLLPETGPAQAAAVADRIQAAIRAYVFDDGVAQARLTLSQGIASFPDHGVTTPEELVQAAAAVLRRAKQAGGDQVQVFVAGGAMA
ncbi:MAG TPA: GGDEF domain-containing protein [Dehalococcoidia bacterium]